jgi:signal transduction histidine kinase
MVAMRSRRYAAPATGSPPVEGEVARRNTVRFRVTTLATLIVGALLLGIAVLLVLVQQRTLTRSLDDGLRQRAAAAAELIALAVPETLPGSGDEDATQLVDTTGTVVATSANLAGDGSIGPDPGGAVVIEVRRLRSLDDDMRVLSQAIRGPGGERLILHVATAADEIADSVAILRTSLLITVPLAVAILAALVWWLVGRALRPVEAIRAEVSSITGAQLDRRVPIPPGDDEVTSLATTMNHMLDRLESSAEHQRRFVADASHELRSPLARIRSELEVDLATPETSDPGATHRSILEEVTAMERLVGDLLHLARSDAGRQESRREPVDLDDLVLMEANRLRTQTTLTIDVSGVSGAQVVGDRAQLGRAIRNLADNAARYAASTVTMALQEADGAAVLTIDDDGPGVPADARGRIFERFARTDEGRSRGDGGTGLGLAIVRDIVERHGGTVSLDDAHRPGARFVVRLRTATSNR